METGGRGGGFSVSRVTRFYVPLLLQGFSQSLSYPLVAGIVTHGAFGVDALTAFSQGQMIMFMIGALGGGLVTTGLVFAKTWLGYVAFRRLNALMMVTLLALQCVPALPWIDDLVFCGLFHLSPELAAVSRETLVLGVVMNAGFFVRNVPMVVLFNNFESGKSNNATLARIFATLAFSVAFPRMGLVGPRWGLFALTVGVWVETAVTWLYARPYVAQLPNRPNGRRRSDEPSVASLPSTAALVAEQFRFTLPLALGGFLLASAPLVVAAFVARTANAADMLAIHYVTLGVANPVAFAALKFQTVAVKFAPAGRHDRRLLWYAVVAGLALGLIPLAFSTPWLGNWYFGSFQNVPERILPTARLAIGIYSLIAVIHAVRARIEGVAAARKRTKAVMWGQIAYTVSLFATLAALLPLGVPGWAMAVAAIFVAPVCVTITVSAALRGWRAAAKAVAVPLAVVACAGLAALPSPRVGAAADEGETAVAEVVEADDSGVLDHGLLRAGTQRLKVRLPDGSVREAHNELRAQPEFDKTFSPGDSALVVLGDEPLVARDHWRLGWAAALFAAFAALLCAFGGWTGAKALFSFVLSCLVVWKALVPLCLAGWNAAWTSFGAVTVLTAAIMLLVAGWTRKGLAAFLGAMLGVAASLALAEFFSAAMRVDGVTMPFVQTLLYSGYAGLDLSDVFVGATILASSGAVMDLAMDIAAGIGEVARHRPDLPRRELLMSGMRIGRSVVGTMTTTLLLAYSGGYLTLLMAFAAQGTRPMDFLNSTLVSAELAKTLVGSFGLVLVAPFTAVVGALVFHRHAPHRD